MTVAAQSIAGQRLERERAFGGGLGRELRRDAVFEQSAACELVQQPLDAGGAAISPLARRRQHHAADIAGAVASEQRGQLIGVDLQDLVRARVVHHEQAGALPPQHGMSRQARAMR